MLPSILYIQWKALLKSGKNLPKEIDESRKILLKLRLTTGGLIHGESKEEYSKLSDHMRSRKEVGDILRTSSTRVTIFRAAIILGQGGGSFQMLEYLVKRLPVGMSEMGPDQIPTNISR